MPTKIKHPAKFSDPILAVIADNLPRHGKILDPFAGTGKIKNAVLIETNLYANDIEKEWISQCVGCNTTVADALNLPYEDNSFDIVITSPSYGNRMADKLGSGKWAFTRNSYAAYLGRELSENNSGAMQWGDQYKNFHMKAWVECKRVLKQGGLFFLNISNHIRKKQEVFVSEWHLQVLLDLGFVLEKHIKIETSRNKQGANSNARVSHENLYILALDKK